MNRVCVKSTLLYKLQPSPSKRVLGVLLLYNEICSPRARYCVDRYTTVIYIDFDTLQTYYPIPYDYELNHTGKVSAPLRACDQMLSNLNIIIDGSHYKVNQCAGVLSLRSTLYCLLLNRGFFENHLTARRKFSTKPPPAYVHWLNMWFVCAAVTLTVFLFFAQIVWIHRRGICCPYSITSWAAGVFFLLLFCISLEATDSSS